jgi:small-conductance mechanosensitive channel
MFSKFFNQFSDWLQTVPDFWIFLLIILLTFLTERLSRRGVISLLKSSYLDDQDSITRFTFLLNAQRLLIFTMGFMFAVREFPPLSKFAGSLLAGAGIAAVAIGFASQQVLSNIISGVFIILFKPFRVNDRLRIQEKFFGTVEDITLRHTVLRDLENRRIIIPNAVINNEIIINSDFHDDKIIRFVDFQISMDSDVALAKNIMAQEVAAHPKFVDMRTDAQKEEGVPLVVVRVVGLDAYSMILRAWASANDNTDAFVLYCDLLESIKKRFDTEGVEIPYPHQVLIKK